MDKVGILTFHAAHNYGSMLQAFALKLVIADLGYESEIINYRNERQKKLYSILSVGVKTQIIRMMHLPKYIKRYKAFEQYLHDYLTSSSEISSTEKVRNYVKGFKAIVCGSDQIWNEMSTTYDRDMIYFLPFNFTGKKVAYAPSMGSDIDLELINNTLIPYIKDFEAVSAREERLSKVLSDCLGKNIPTVLDPTLLVADKVWEKQLVDINERNYICFYSLIYSDELVKFAMTASQKLGMKVVNLSPRAKYATISSFEQRYDIGPREFLSYIKNAGLVITNSFHGTVFSILFRRPLFSLIIDPDKQDFRRQNLFSITGLPDMYFPVTETSAIEERFSRIKAADYSSAELNLNKAKTYSMNFLKEALQ
mgnify:CR=1 FL=1